MLRVQLGLDVNIRMVWSTMGKNKPQSSFVLEVDQSAVFEAEIQVWLEELTGKISRKM